MGELTYFLGLQIKQLKDGIFINQAKYVKELLKKFNMENAKSISTPMAINTKLDADEKVNRWIKSNFEVWSVHSFIWLQVDRIFTSVFACVLVFKQIRKSLICLLWKGFFDISCPPKNLVYGLLITMTLGSLHTRMQIMRVVGLNERVLVVLVTFLEGA